MGNEEIECSLGANFFCDEEDIRDSSCIKCEDDYTGIIYSFIDNYYMICDWDIKYNSSGDYYYWDAGSFKTI